MSKTSYIAGPGCHLSGNPLVNRSPAAGPVIPLSQIEEILDRYPDCVQPAQRQPWREFIGRDPKLAEELLLGNRRAREAATAKAIANRAQTIQRQERVSTSEAWQRATAELQRG